MRILPKFALISSALFYSRTFFIQGMETRADEQIRMCSEENNDQMAVGSDELIAKEPKYHK